MHAALQKLDHNVRREYEEAVATAPALVRDESKVEDFLLRENYDPTLAATSRDI